MSLYGGLGWDVGDDSLWIGTVGRIFEINELTGVVLGGFVLPSSDCIAMRLAPRQ